jgi:hypothetical protein
MDPLAKIEIRKKLEAPYHIQALLGMLPILLGIQLLAWFVILPAAIRGRADFRQLYTAGYMVRTGHARELYNYDVQLHFQNELVSPSRIPLPFNRPAFYALLFVPFSLLPYRGAYLVFLALNLILLLSSYCILRPWLRNIAQAWIWLPVLIFMAFYPVAAALMQGQDSILVLILLAAVLMFLSRDQEFLAGLLLGLGWFKFTLVLPIAFLYIVWRRWRFSVGFAFSTLLAVVGSLALVGFAQSEHYVRSLLSTNTGLSARTNDFSYPIPVQFEFMANLHGLIAGLAGRHVPAFSIHVAALLVSAVVWIWIARVTPGHLRPVEAFPVAVAASVVVSYYLFLYDLSILLIPITLLLNRLLDPEFQRDSSSSSAGWITLLLLIAPLSDPFVPSYRYLLSLPVCAFLLVLVRNYGRLPSHGRDLHPRYAPAGESV